MHQHEACARIPRPGLYGSGAAETMSPPSPTRPPALDLLTLEHFGGCVNETFRAQLDGMQIEFVLVEARAQPARGAHPAARAPFSLLFRNSAPVLFPQQIYPMHHERLGDIGIFLVPVAQERGGFLYQAVFN